MTAERSSFKWTALMMVARSVGGSFGFSLDLCACQWARARPSIKVDGISELYAEPDAILIRISLQE